MTVSAAAAEAPAPAPPKKKRRTQSIIHDSGEFTLNSLVLLHLDLETGGETVGIIQLSCVALSGSLLG